MGTFRLVLFAGTLAFAQVPDSGTRHDRRGSFLELGWSANTGFPDVFRPQLEILAKRRGFPVFLSGRLGLGFGDWLGHAAVVAHSQAAIHWTRDGEDSWALRLGFAQGEWFQSRMEFDSILKESAPAESVLRGNSIALERTAYFGPSTDLAWRAALGAASAWHRYEVRGAPRGAKSSSILPFFELGLLWTTF